MLQPLSLALSLGWCHLPEKQLIEDRVTAGCHQFGGVDIHDRRGRSHNRQVVAVGHVARTAGRLAFAQHPAVQYEQRSQQAGNGWPCYKFQAVFHRIGIFV